MKNFKHLNVFFKDSLVGTISNNNGLFYFEYDDNWLQEGFSISPFSLPLEKKIFKPNFKHFRGLFGVFYDSLLGSWGHFQIKNLLAKNDIDPYEIDILNYLAIMQKSSIGALTYFPKHPQNIDYDYNLLAKKCSELLAPQNTDNLDELYKNERFSGIKARLIFTQINGEDWIIKIPSQDSQKDFGKMEYKYSLCAKKCGINMTETTLLESKECSGFFGIKRFDRINGEKVHMITASALLESDKRSQILDYNILMKATSDLTHSYQDIEQLYRLMCFNVFAHNRDDHSDNFAFLYNEKQNTWNLAPAFDLTYSTPFGDEHTIAINGERIKPDINDILAVAKNIGIEKQKAKNIAIEIRDNIFSMLT